jgi:hypothetical protein
MKLSRSTSSLSEADLVEARFSRDTSISTEPRSIVAAAKVEPQLVEP